MRPLAALVLLAGCATPPEPVPTAREAAYTPCAPRQEAVAQLGSEYQESQAGIGLANNGGMVELWTTDTGSTWSLTITLPNGLTCMIVPGQDWQATPEGKRT